MKRIVVASDGSDASLAALRWVASRPTLEGTSLDIVATTAHRQDDRAQVILNDAAHTLHDVCPMMPVRLRRLLGTGLEPIVEFARHSDLLVVGVDPARLHTEATGRLPLTMSARSDVPVCVVPVGWAGGDAPVTVGIGDDGSDSALDFASEEASATGHGVRLVHAWLMPVPGWYTSERTFLDEAVVERSHRAQLDAALLEVRRRSPHLRADAVLARDSRASALQRFGSRSSMIVLGTGGCGVAAGALFGSVAQELLRRVECPVCVVPARAASLTRAEESPAP